MAALVLVAEVLQSASPLVPTPFEWTALIFGATHVILLLAVMVWLPRQKAITPIMRIVGLVVALVVPLFGPLLVWLSARRTSISSNVDKPFRSANGPRS